MRIGETRARLVSFVVWPLCEMIALARYRSVWREQPPAAIRRTVLLPPVALLVMAAASVQVFSASANLGAAVLAVAAVVIAVLLVGPGWVRVVDDRAGLSLGARAPLDGRARIAVGSFWAYPPGRGHGRRVMNAVLAVADEPGVPRPWRGRPGGVLTSRSQAGRTAPCSAIRRAVAPGSALAP